MRNETGKPINSSLSPVLFGRCSTSVRSKTRKVFSISVSSKPSPYRSENSRRHRLPLTRRARSSGLLCSSAWDSRSRVLSILSGLLRSGISTPDPTPSLGFSIPTGSSPSRTLPQDSSKSRSGATRRLLVQIWRQFAPACFFQPPSSRSELYPTRFGQIRPDPAAALCASVFPAT